MEQFFKLLDFELKRAKGFFLSLLAFVFIIQSIGIVNLILSLRKYAMSDQQAMMKLDFHSLFAHNGWYNFVFIVSLTALFMFAIFSWAREWRGQGNYIYRLMLLPMPRVSIAYAKLLSIILLTFSLISLQYFFAWSANGILSTIMSADNYQFCCLSGGMLSLALILPNSIVQISHLFLIGLILLLIIYNVTINYFSNHHQTIIFRLLSSIGEMMISLALLYMAAMSRFFIALTDTGQTIVYILLLGVILLLLLIRMHHLMTKKLSV